MVSPSDTHFLFRVKLTPNAARNQIKGWDRDEKDEAFLRVSVTTIPENGKANEALIKLLSKELKIPKTALTLEKGATDRIKIFAVDKSYEGRLSVIPKA
ncbi:MAG: DUF167 domain-containing protein [Pseudobdellovibrionaceae bacterium]